MSHQPFALSPGLGIVVPPHIQRLLEPITDDDSHLTLEERNNRRISRVMEAQSKFTLPKSNHLDPVLAAQVGADLERLYAREERAREKAEQYLDEDDWELSGCDDSTDEDDCDGEQEDDDDQRHTSSVDNNKNTQKGSRKKRKLNPPDVANQGFSLDDVIGVGSSIFSSAALQDPPTMPGTSQRASIIARLLDSMSANERRAFQSDSVKLDEDVKLINRKGDKVTLIPFNDGWKLLGMQTTLKHYQATALAFMRNQERKTYNPKGGILADVMGLGKTVEMIANIVKAKVELQREQREIRSQNLSLPRHAKLSLPPRPTLIIVPSTLLHQWDEQLHLHARVVEHKAKKDESTPEHKEAWHFGIHGVIVYSKLKHLSPAAKTAELQKYDIVLATYHNVMKSWPSDVEQPPAELDAKGKKAWQMKLRKKLAGPLHQVSWLRVVLDEAQWIKNHRTLTSTACRLLKSRHYWAMTGTPAVNSLNEFFPYLKLIKEPLAQSYSRFSRNFCDPSNELCQPRLQMLLVTCCLRRTLNTTLFGKKLLSIPPATPPRTLHLELNPTERYIYRLVESAFRSQVKQLVSGETKSVKVYTQVYAKMLRLRQAAGHFILLHNVIPHIMTRGAIEQLCKQVTISEAEDSAESIKLALMLMCRDECDARHKQHDVQYPNAGLDELRELVPDAPLGIFGEINVDYAKYFDQFASGPLLEQVEQQTLCVLCAQKPQDTHITQCGHAYCYKCLDGLLGRALRMGQQKAVCYECAAEFEGAKRCPVVESPEHDSQADKARDKTFSCWLKDIKGPIAPSTKTMAMKAVVTQWIQQDPTVKIIVYSQFIDMLKILQNVCKCERWTYQHYNGSMDVDARARAIQAFTAEDGNIRILLASLKCGSLGLNLTAASKVLLMDSWFNDAVEEQAFCRVFRHGQNKETSLTRLVVKDTIDEALEIMKAKKAQAISTVLFEDGYIRVKPTMEEMMQLFGKGQPDIEAHTFDMSEGEDGGDNHI